MNINYDQDILTADYTSPDCLNLFLISYCMKIYYTFKRFLYNSIVRRAVNTNLTMLNRK